MIGLTVAAQPAIHVLPTQYPPSETYLFAPLNERVAAYQKPFRLVRDIVVKGTTPQAHRAGRDRPGCGAAMRFW